MNTTNDNVCIYCGNPSEPLICSDACQRDHFGLEPLRYEVQTDTIADGWINTWQEGTEPLTFDTKAEAEAGLLEFFEDLREAGMANKYSPKDYRITEVAV